MSSGGDYARREIRQMAGYVPGRQPPPGSKIIKLNTNESPFPPSPAVVQALVGGLADGDFLRRYPDPQSLELRRVAASIVGCGADQVIAGNGSDELLRILLDTFVEKGEKVAFFTPS